MSTFDQVFSSCQSQYEEQAKQRNQSWLPPAGFSGAIAYEGCTEKSGIDKNQVPYVSLVPKFRVLDGEHANKEIARNIFLSEKPRPGFNAGMNELCAIASCLMGKTVTNIREAREALQSQAGAAIDAATKAWSSGGKSGINIYFNRRIDSKKA